MSNTKTHWREFHETDYLGSHDLVAEGLSEIVLTIKQASKKSVKDQNGKDEICLVCEFEGSKPMILNATNCKSVEKVNGSPFVQDWSGTSVSVYILKGVMAFGKVVDALRIREFAPKITIPVEEINEDLATLDACTTLDELKLAYPKCKHAKNAKVVAKKDALKKTLS